MPRSPPDPVRDDYPRLVGDIGGTHARFASIDAPGGALLDLSVHDCDDFDGIEALLHHRLSTQHGRAPRSCALGLATPVTGDAVRLTNRDWSFSTAGVRDRLRLPRLLVLNDFETLSRALPTLADDALHFLGGGAGSPMSPKAVLGPGTGLGVGGLTGHGAWAVPIVGEGGHVSLAAEDELEDQILRHLRERFGHVSAERVLSGPGLVNLHAAICAISGSPAGSMTPSDITRRAIEGGDPACAATVERFLGWLGAVAGDIALTMGARGGVYVGGGIAPHMLPLFAASAFRDRFERKGRFAAYLAAIPTWLITDASDAALRGADAALDADAAQRAS